MNRSPYPSGRGSATSSRSIVLLVAGSLPTSGGLARPPFPLGPSHSQGCRPLGGLGSYAQAWSPLPRPTSQPLMGLGCPAWSGLGHVVALEWGGWCREKGIEKPLSSAGVQRGLSCILPAGLPLTAPHTAQARWLPHLLFPGEPPPAPPWAWHGQSHSAVARASV